MINIKPFLRTYKKDPRSGIVWVKFYLKSEKIHFSTSMSCKIEHWDSEEMRILSKDPNNKDKNIIIQNILSRINNVVVRFRLKNKTLTPVAFKKAYNRPDDYDTFFQFVREWQKKFGFKNELATMAVHKTVIDKVERYNPDLHFDDITTDWLDEYYSDLRKVQKNNDNTAYKNMSTIRKYVRLAHKAGYMDENPFEDWKIKRAQASYTYLHKEELNRFLKYYTGGSCDPNHYFTLEFFLFMCFSSLHITDAKNLKLEQFTTESFTYFRIKNRNSKPQPINIPISANLQRILTNIVGYRKKGKIFENLPTDQAMNKILKKIATALEVDKNISHKTARHTFATYFLSKTKDLASLKELLGHSELRETLIYAHVLDESKQEGIKFFDEFEL